MIPILYDYAERRFTTNGYGRLSDCISCKVTEERNGIYECEFEYPMTGAHYSEIKEGMVIGVTHDETGDIQPFDIYAHDAPIDGVVTFYAHHVSYRLSNVVVMPFTATTVVSALDGLTSYAANPHDFEFWTDKTSSGSFELAKPDYARAILGGQQGSILDAFGKGDYEFDRFTVKLWANRGQNSGVTIRYGKNLVDIKEKTEADGTYNAVVPFWLGSEGALVTLPEKVLIYSGATIYEANLTNENQVIIRDHLGNPITVTYQQINAIPLDMSSDFQEQPTESELRDAATAKFNASEGWLPKQNIDVDFVQLWQTEEYENFAPLQRVGLCDTVSVYYDELGVNAVDMRVCKTVFNVLLDRYDSIELGQLQNTLAQTITSPIEAQLEDVPTTSMLNQAIQHATDLIRGGLGGYVVMKPNADGQPEELLVMDTPDINTAVNVWRWNLNGLGHSHSGYDGPYDDVALTMDGQINANMITTGTMTANHIKGGTLSLGGAGNGDGVLQVKNASNTVIGTWDRTGITATNATITGNVTTETSSYYTTMSSGLISAGKISGSTRTQTGFISPNYQYTSENAFVFAAQTGCLVLGCNSNIYFTNSSVTGTAKAYIDTSGRLHCTNAVGTGQTVYIPASIGTGGVVSSYYTWVVRSGILYAS